MSSMDTSSIIVHHGTVQYSTVQYSRRIPISRNLKFFEITDNSNPSAGLGGGGGGMGWRLPLFQVTGMIEGFEIFGSWIFLVRKIWQVVFGVA